LGIKLKQHLKPGKENQFPQFFPAQPGFIFHPQSIPPWKQPKKIPTYLFAFIDDCSRLITFAMFLTEQNIEPLKETFKQALFKERGPRTDVPDEANKF